MSNVAPNIFPSSNDPTEIEVVQEVANLAAIQAAITTLQSYIDNGSGAKPASNKSLVDMINALQTIVTTLETYIFNGSGAVLATNKSLVDMLNAIPTNPVLATTLTAAIVGYLNNANLGTIPNISALMTDLVAWLNNSGNALPATTSLYDAITMKLAAPATLSQVTPTQNTYYNILATASNVEAIYVTCSVATTGETLQVKLVIDGATYTGSLACTAGTLYYVTLTAFSAAGVPTFTLQTTAAPLGGSAYSLGGRSVAISVEKTTNSGSGTLTGAVLYKTR